MRKIGLTAGGFVSIGEFEDSNKQSYFLQDVQTGKRYLLASKIADASRPQVFGSYSFDPATFAAGSRILRNSLDADAIVLDEYGPLEQGGEGFREALEYLLAHYRGILFIAARPSLLDHLQTVLKNHLPPLQSFQEGNSL